MKVNDSLKKAPTQGVDVKENKAADTRSAGADAAKSSPAVNTGSAASVNLSAQLQSVIGQLSETSVFDTQKVDEIKAAMAKGQFQVDSGKVADGLLKTVSDLLQQHKG